VVGLVWVFVLFERERSDPTHRTNIRDGAFPTLHGYELSLVTSHGPARVPYKLFRGYAEKRNYFVYRDHVLQNGSHPKARQRRTAEEGRAEKHAAAAAAAA
jgi:hypothetical protein